MELKGYVIMELDVEIIRSDRKTVSIEITPQCDVRLRIPRAMPASEAEKIINAKREWIKKHIEAQKKKSEAQETPKKLDQNEIRSLAEKTKKLLKSKLERYAKLMNVEYNRVTIRDQRTRWGSCSEKSNLNFNLLTALLPDDIADYIVVHELSHLKEMNHSPKFWNEVEKIIPDYKEKEKWLKQNGAYYISMLP